MNKLLLSLTVIVVLGSTAFASSPARPDVPANLQVPTNEEVVLQTHATGVQIYVCQADPGQPPAWVLKGPEADLTDAQGKNIVHHYAGPSWKHVDGSVVTGKVTAKQDAPIAGAIPWLLLSATTHVGNGIFTPVTSIQRIHTEGGLPPNADTCNTAANGKESQSKYSADYYFYAPASK